MGDPHVLVIGGGTAGLTCARTLARSGIAVALAEPDRLGGTALWRGCIPKKALYQAASVHRTTRGAEQFGTLPGTVRVDWPAVLAWKWHAQETCAGDQEAALAELGVALLRDSARFLSPDRITVGETVLQPEHVVIATGSAPLGLPVPGGPLADSSDDALRYPTLPQTLTIVGSGYVAMEFAAIFASFGTRVTMMSHTSHFLTSFDPECVDVALGCLRDLGVTVLTDVNTTAIAGKPGDLRLTYLDQAGTERTLASERVMAAIGRSPSLESLDLGVARIELDMRGRPVLDSALRTSNRRVYVAGDAAGMGQHTPLAALHGHAIATSILTSRTVEPDVLGLPVTCFTLPQIARTGLGEDAARENGTRVVTHRVTYEHLGSAVVSDTRHGLVKLVADEGTGVVLGAQIAGQGAGDLIYPMSLAVRTRATLDDLRGTLAVHPAFSEIVNWSAGQGR